jgi:small-conductance mechanosensitive channel
MEALMEALRRSELEAWLAALFSFVVMLGVLTVVRRVVWGQLTKRAAATATNWDDLLLKASRAPAGLLNLVASMALALQVAPPAARDHALTRAGPKILLALCVLWMIERLAAVTFEARPLQGRVSESGRRLWLTLVRLLVVVVGLLVIMDTLGVNITPVLASLGVGSLAVALAVQDTLSNFFAGLYLLVDRPVSIGDNVRLEDGTEGNVATIGWRSTQVRLGNNSVVIIPNAKLAASRLTNFDLPDPEFLVAVPVGVSHGSDLERVETVTLDVARALQTTHAAAVPGYSPVMRYTALAESAVTFNVFVRARNYDVSFVLKHDFIKALHARYRQEKVEIPFPQRAVHLVKEG